MVTNLNNSTASLDDLYRSIVQAFEAQANPELAQALRPFHKNDDFACYGLNGPQIHSVIKSFRKQFRQLSTADRVSLAEHLFASGISELANAGIALLALSTAELLPGYRDFIERLPDDFHSWGTTDDFCINVAGPLLIENRDETFQILDRWNRSPIRWKRRASVVAFTRKIGASGKFTAECLHLCDRLIWDQDDLVRKGVGWALKDCMRGEKKQVLEYIRRLRGLGVSSVITLYAIRDLKGGDRLAVLAIQPEKSGKEG